jgi:hypothetical protein
VPGVLDGGLPPMPEQGRWYACGPFLPDDVLRKVYYENAARAGYYMITVAVCNKTQKIRRRSIMICGLICISSRTF